jgi:hypothetical protein
MGDTKCSAYGYTAGACASRSPRPAQRARAPAAMSEPLECLLGGVFGRSSSASYGSDSTDPNDGLSSAPGAGHGKKISTVAPLDTKQPTPARRRSASVRSGRASTGWRAPARSASPATMSSGSVNRKRNATRTICLHQRAPCRTRTARTHVEDPEAAQAVHGLAARTAGLDGGHEAWEAREDGEERERGAERGAATEREEHRVAGRRVGAHDERGGRERTRGGAGGGAPRGVLARAEPVARRGAGVHEEERERELLGVRRAARGGERGHADGRGKGGRAQLEDPECGDEEVEGREPALVRRRP